MPCLNEAETLATCIQKAKEFLRVHSVDGEIIVADNGSSDGSVQIAQSAGARVVRVAERGYGSALMAGFQAARGKYLIMGDADDSYDFTGLLPFLQQLRGGVDLVMGNRFRGGIRPQAMPLLHRHLGNPVLTGVLNLFFRTGVGDAHCGLRGLTRDCFERINLRTTGMEFASEMIVKAVAHKCRIAEVPTTLQPDGRSRPPHLRSFRDGWRHLRFLLLICPEYTLIWPGLALIAVGVLAFLAVLFGPLPLGRTVLDVHTLLAGGLFIILGYQGVTIGLAARIFALQEELGPPSPLLHKSFKYFTLERGVLGGLLFLTSGIIPIAWLTVRWVSSDFGPLTLDHTLRPMIAGSTLSILGLQTVLMSFFYSMLGIQRKK